jgi:hypothetical protein
MTAPINVKFKRDMALQMPTGAASFTLSDTYPIVTLVFSNDTFLSQVAVKNGETITTSDLPKNVQMTVNLNWVEGTGKYQTAKSASFTLSPAAYLSCVGNDCNISRDLIFPGTDPQVLFSLKVIKSEVTTWQYTLTGQANFNTLISYNMPAGNWKALTLYNGTDKSVCVTASTPGVTLTANSWDQIGVSSFCIPSKSVYYFCYYPCATTLTFLIPDTKTYPEINEASVVFGKNECSAGNNGFEFMTNVVKNVDFNSGTAVVPLLSNNSTSLANSRIEFSISPTSNLPHTPCTLLILPEVYYKVYVATAVPMFCPWNTFIVPEVETYTGVFYPNAAPPMAKQYAPTLSFTVTARNTLANKTDSAGAVTMPNASTPLTELITSTPDIGQFVYDVLVTVSVSNTKPVTIKGSFHQVAENNTNFSNGNAVTTILYDQFNRPWFRMIAQPKQITLGKVLTPVFTATLIGLDYTNKLYKPLLDPFKAKNMGNQNMFNGGSKYFLPGLMFTMGSSKGLLRLTTKYWYDYLIKVGLTLTAIMASGDESPNFTFERVTTATQDYLLLKTADDGLYVQPFDQKTPNCTSYDTYTYLGTAGSVCKVPDNPNDLPVCQWAVAFSTNQLGTQYGDSSLNENTLLLKMGNGNILYFHVKIDSCYGATITDANLFPDSDYDYNPYVMLSTFNTAPLPVRAWLPYGPFFANPYYRRASVGYKTTGLTFLPVVGKGTDTNLSCLAGVIDMPAGCDGLTNSCILNGTELGEIMCIPMRISVAAPNASTFINKYCGKKFTQQENAITCNTVVGVPQTECSGFLSADYGASCEYICKTTDGKAVCDTAKKLYCETYTASADCACIKAGQPGNNFSTPLLLNGDRKPMPYTEMVGKLTNVAYDPHCVWLPCVFAVPDHALITSEISAACPTTLISCINTAVVGLKNSTGITLAQINDCEVTVPKGTLNGSKKTATQKPAQFYQPWGIAALCLGGLLLVLFVWVVVLALRPKAVQKSTVYFMG